MMVGNISCSTSRCDLPLRKFIILACLSVDSMPFNPQLISLREDINILFSL